MKSNQLRGNEWDRLQRFLESGLQIGGGDAAQKGSFIREKEREMLEGAYVPTLDKSRDICPFFRIDRSKRKKGHKSLHIPRAKHLPIHVQSGGAFIFAPRHFCN